MSEKIKEKEGEKKPIIKIGIWKFREAWYRLSPAERVEMGDKILAKYKELGIRQIIPFCDCYWSCEEWEYFAAEEYPDIETVQKFEEFLMEIGHNRTSDSRIYMGTRMTAEEIMKLNMMGY